MFTKIPFQIDYPLKIFHPTKEINFMNQEEREKLFERNIYYNLFGDKRNNLLEKKHELFFELGNKVLDYMKQSYPTLDMQNLSLFGSSIIIRSSGGIIDSASIRSLAVTCPSFSIITVPSFNCFIIIPPRYLHV